MKQVLWVSRHEMTPEQFKDLERVMNGSVELVNWKDTVKDVQNLLPILDYVDAAAVVLPTEKLAELMKCHSGKPILQAISKREPTGFTRILADGRQEPEFRFVHQGWQQILRLELETKML